MSNLIRVPLYPFGHYSKLIDYVNCSIAGSLSVGSDVTNRKWAWLIIRFRFIDLPTPYGPPGSGRG